MPMWPQELTARDGLKLVSYLTLPAEADANHDSKAEKPVPLVLYVHSGPWARDSYGCGPYEQWLANRGYAVLSVNFRGSTGFGTAFTNAGNGEWAGKMHDDLLDAVQWAVKRGVTKPDDVAIMGGSYGGYATLVGMPFITLVRGDFHFRIKVGRERKPTGTATQTITTGKQVGKIERRIVAKLEEQRGTATNLHRHLKDTCAWSMLSQLSQHTMHLPSLCAQDDD